MKKKLEQKMVVFTRVEDNGQRTKYPTGALREMPAGKGRFDLIPGYPLFRLAVHYENGVTKYPDRNWEKGLPLSSFVKSIGSHYAKILEGGKSEDHFSAISWNAMGFIYTEHMIALGKLPRSLDDFHPGGSSSPDDTKEAHGLLPGPRAVRSAHLPRTSGRKNRPAKQRAQRVSRSH